MPSVQVPSPRRRSWPRDGLWAALGLLGAGVAVGLGLGGAVSPLIGGLAAGCAIALVILTCKSQTAAARLANQLCRDDDAPRRSLIAALNQIAAQLDGHERRAANIHPITGLPTREHLAEQIALDLAAPRGQMLLGGVRFADFDRLAAFDLPAANNALAAFAKRLAAAAKTNHIVGQIDRDCIAIWFRDSADPDAAAAAAAAAAEFRALVYVASQPLAQGEPTLTPTVEAAAVTFPDDADDAPHLFVRLTAALNRAEPSSAGEVRLTTPLSTKAAREQFMLEQDLTRAIDEDQLKMVFQPVVDLEQRRMIGAEALLRWDHPELGPISPARFIPIIEATGMSDRYGLWVLNAACREARLWQDEGLTGIKLAVNLSARQLTDPDLKDKVIRTLQRHDLPATALEFELTETAAMADADRTFHLFGALREIGISLAIDDFGAGYSSLGYLKKLPFDKLKIDREFVTDVDSRRDSAAICRALIELCSGLDLLVLAEGVENAREVEALRGLGCNVFQGYHFSKPLAGDDFRKLAADSEWLASLGGPVTVSAPKGLLSV
jgi:EAL domain-containing protein (putative c-di-GMP-specific phosphodiesterase class I)/GGDEF domain-containing protein